MYYLQSSRTFCIGSNKAGSSLLAVIKIDMNEYKVASETVYILNKKTSKYLEAFKEWL
jgi:hypothetical protein